MKTYLLPIDFSKASVHAAEFAAALSHQTDVDHIILLNAYYVTVYETTLPTPDMTMITQDEIEANVAERLASLEKIKKQLEKHVRPGVEISTHLNRTHLVRAIVEVSIARTADLVIVGSTGNSSHSDYLIGSHIVKISKLSPVPVIVVPPHYNFEHVNRIVVACDVNKVSETVPLEGLKKLLSKKKLDLLVVNIDDSGKHNNGDAERAAEESALHDMLKPFHPRYSFINSKNVINGILEFAEDNDAQLVIALPHKYSFLQSLMHTSISIQLTKSSAVPVLLLK
jgi:nucleotide-binding universal stress UspA family protein